MSDSLYGVYGASGFGREVMPLARNIVLKNNDAIDRLVFIDDKPEGNRVNGQGVVTFEEFMAIGASERYVSLGIANGTIREQLAARCESVGIKSWSVSAENIIVMDDSYIGEGSILCPFVTITSNARIGKFFHANLYSYVAHDCIIGDYVTFAPGVKCNGNVTIKNHAYIGTGAIIKQGRPGRPIIIGEGAIVGAGAVVTKNVPAGITVIGNPASILSKENLSRK